MRTWGPAQVLLDLSSQVFRAEGRRRPGSEFQERCIFLSGGFGVSEILQVRDVVHRERIPILLKFVMR